MKNGRVNERNSGVWSADSKPKTRTKAGKGLSENETALLSQILEKVLNCLERDTDGPGPLNPESRWTDGGNFLISMTGAQKDELYNALEKLTNG
jgi:hypothetical protein